MSSSVASSSAFSRRSLCAALFGLPFIFGFPKVASASTLRKHPSFVETMSNADLLSFRHLEAVFPRFEITNHGKLTLGLTDAQLASEYNLTDLEIAWVHDLLVFHANASSAFGQNRMHISDWKIYFTNGDVVTLLWQAALAGPPAIIAALSALGTIYPGVGNIIGGIIGLLGGSTICYWVLQAVANRQGLYVGIDWNGPFPNPAIGTW